MEGYNADRFGIPKNERDRDFQQRMRAASQTDSKALKKEAGKLTEKGIKSGLKAIGEGASGADLAVRASDSVGATSYLSSHVPMVISHFFPT
jgi:hypothetical protein